MSPDPRHERLDELLCDRALVGLTAAEVAELARLSVGSGAEPGEGTGAELELAAAALDLALAPRPAALPDALRARLVAAARDLVPPLPASRVVPARDASAPRGRRFALAGWVVAAAACVVAFLAWRARAPGVPDPAELRAELAARADTLRRDWTATEQAPGASGDVAWSQALQQGVLRIQGLAPNDPAKTQYQLWIFDESQEHPIDGGVFDVSGGEVLVPIDAKLRVQQPKLFAVTVERPGGVVVSDQKRIVLVAQI